MASVLNNAFIALSEGESCQSRVSEDMHEDVEQVHNHHDEPPVGSGFNSHAKSMKSGGSYPSHDSDAASSGLPHTPWSHWHRDG